MSSKVKIELMFSPKEINYLHRLLSKTHCDECLMGDTKKCGKCPVYRMHCTVKQKVQEGYEQKARLVSND